MEDVVKLFSFMIYCVLYLYTTYMSFVRKECWERMSSMNSLSIWTTGGGKDAEESI